MVARTPVIGGTPDVQSATLGSGAVDDYQGHLDDAAEVTQSHRDAIVRHRRAMLDLNTAVGLRILP